jgi:hypothetical protein
MLYSFNQPNVALTPWNSANRASYLAGHIDAKTPVMKDHNEPSVCASVKVTAALLLPPCAIVQTGVYRFKMKLTPTYERSVINMKRTTSKRIRIFRFFPNRYTYSERPDYLIELVAFGILAITATLSLVNAVATTPR